MRIAPAMPSVPIRLAAREVQEPPIASKPSNHAQTMIEQIQGLINMRQNGALTDEEFQRLKAALMDTI